MRSLLNRGEVIMVGPVVTELLQGIRSDQQRGFLANLLASLEYIEANKETWQRAGAISSQLLGRGITMGFADLIIATLSIQHRVALYTTDGAFREVPGLQLYEPENV